MTPLPQAFLDRLAAQEELLVTSRDGPLQRSVRTWFAIEDGGTILLFAEAYSRKVTRWRADPWVRLAIPGTRVQVEGVVRFLAPEDVDRVAPLVTRRWADWGATHGEGVRRMLRGGTHVLLRVEGSA
ncbi:MAG TPA: pyridoxamine 5'-phosphate oxidase family protein [Candidatus Limnocylindrales bacterium]|nr:pyridoxamine 5'-phosphate oxidase family protein [Candidatus Limnocylindrales bacterium]